LFEGAVCALLSCLAGCTDLFGGTDALAEPKPLGLEDAGRVVFFSPTGAGPKDPILCGRLMFGWGSEGRVRAVDVLLFTIFAEPVDPPTREFGIVVDAFGAPTLEESTDTAI
jgi:hypothetical protein